VVRRVAAPEFGVGKHEVRAGDVVLLRYPEVQNTRWLLVDYVTEHVATPVWSGRWAFGKDAGEHAARAATRDRYVRKNAAEARRVWQRLEGLRGES
jgi:hypothetical protein